MTTGFLNVMDRDFFLATKVSIKIKIKLFFK